MVRPQNKFTFKAKLPNITGEQVDIYNPDTNQNAFHMVRREQVSDDGDFSDYDEETVDKNLKYMPYQQHKQ